jgi:formylglycine-generating enzyme required for sulfatase activity
MLGNVWEWCNDLWGTAYPAPSATDPTGANTGKGHVTRGGSAKSSVGAVGDGDNGTCVISTFRYSWPENLSISWDLGLRVCAMKDNHVATPLGGTIKKVSVNTTSGALNFQLAFIPKGKFWTGGTPTGTVTLNNTNTTLPSTEVTLTQSYYMGTTPVTNVQFATFLNDMHIGQDGKMSNDSIGIYDSKIYSNGQYPQGVTWNTISKKWESCSGYENFPVIYVSWFGATAYCNWLTDKRLGLIFKLPTEAQWQNAAQCGTQYKYNGLSDTWDDDFGWTSTNSKGHTHEVCTAIKGKNIWNLNDMHGNVWDWCSDRYGNVYPAPTATDPTGASSAINYVIRGGSWWHDPQYEATTLRASRPVSEVNYNSGFRVCAMTN